MSHVRWPDLLPLALRLRAVQAMLGAGPSCEEFATDEHAAAVLSTFNDVGTGRLASAGRKHRAEEDADAEGPAVDAYFRRVADQLAEDAGRLRRQSRLAEQLLSALDTALRAPVCPKCCAQPESQPELTACRWTRLSGAADAAAMATRGECIQALSEVFRFASEVTAEAYEDACGERLETRLRLSTGTDPRNAELELAVSARTDEDHTDSLHTRIVSLSFDVTSMWVEDYLSLAYICVHECVAHGYCGVDINDVDAGASTAFHEGWMDCVAAYVLEDALLNAPGALEANAGTFARQMRAVISIRYNRSRAAAARDVDKWICGEQAFHAFERLFSKVLGRRQKLGLAELARQRVVAFSLALNASEISHLERSRFCRAVLQHYGDREEKRAERQTQDRPQVFDFIEHFLHSNDFEKLLSNVVAIR